MSVVIGLRDQTHTWDLVSDVGMFASLTLLCVRLVLFRPNCTFDLKFSLRIQT